MIVIVSDFFSHELIGGAELTTDSLLEEGFDNFKKIKSHLLTSDHIKELKDKEWIFFNYSNVSDNNILELIKNSINYSVVEYDYKYCFYRLKSKHEFLHKVCDCEKTTRGKLISCFMAKSKNLFFMAEKQKQIYEKLFPFLKNHTSSYVISSSFSEKDIQIIKNLNTNKKNDKFLILNSDSWVKGTDECIKYAKDHKLEYELVNSLNHNDLLKKMAVSRGIIFLPKGFDTCPRITIEAKLLDCELIINDNVQHKDELWFKTKESIIDHNKKQKNLFYNKCLKQQISFIETDKNTNFHFIIPGYNVEEWLTKCLASIKKQEYQNYSVTFINDVSSDDSKNIFLKEANENSKFKIINNDKKLYALKNISLAINNLEANEEDVIIILDADDWLSSPYVLSYLNSVYQKEKCLMTYGSYMYYPHGDKGIEPSQYPDEVIKNNDYRSDSWRASHLRTFKKKLWDKINPDDFIDEDKEFYKMAYDQALMLPMLEMAAKRSKYISEILHVYNRANVLNVDKIKQKEQFETMLRIRKKDKYKEIKFED